MSDIETAMGTIKKYNNDFTGKVKQDVNSLFQPCLRLLPLLLGNFTTCQHWFI